MGTIEKLEKIIDKAGHLLIHNGLIPCRNYINSQLASLTISLEYDPSLTDQDISIINTVKERIKNSFTLQEMAASLQECKRNIRK